MSGVVRRAETRGPPTRQRLALVAAGEEGELARIFRVNPRESSRRDVELIALHAWSDVCASGLPGWEWSAPGSESSFADSLAHWQERYPNVTVQRVVVCDEPALQLVEKAESAQLVVVGSHGRGAFDRMVLGSVSNTVLHSVRIPVIVARPS